MKKFSKKTRKRLITALCLIVLIPAALFGGFCAWYYSVPGVTASGSGITELVPNMSYLRSCVLYNGRYYSNGNLNSLIGFDDAAVENLTGEVLYQLQDTDRLCSLPAGSIVSVRGYDTDFRIAVKSSDGDPQLNYFIVMDSLEKRTLHRGADLLAVLLHANGNGRAVDAFLRDSSGGWGQSLLNGTWEQKDLDRFLRRLMLTPFTEQQFDYSKEHVQLRLDLQDGTHLSFDIQKNGMVFPDTDALLFDQPPCLWLSPEETAIFFSAS